MRKIMLLTATMLAIATSGAMAVDLENGEKVFKKCAACHALEPGAPAKAGPNLHGVIGTVIASEPADYAFSPALKALGAEGKVWDDANLTAWLAKPTAFAKGTKMSFPGLKKPEDIADVIAYIKSKQQ